MQWKAVCKVFTSFGTSKTTSHNHGVESLQVTNKGKERGKKRKKEDGISSLLILSLEFTYHPARASFPLRASAYAKVPVLSKS